ncbi:hypothetical protein [Halobaculum sp. D14]|uniref:hypothetical protein n=1 Tax=Halobaculum sp. D14 TaxID=3421642 RepID=UPI003EBE327E
MTMMLNMVVGMQAGFATYALVRTFGPPWLPARAAGFLIGAVAFMLWTSSSLPNSNAAYSGQHSASDDTEAADD